MTSNQRFTRASARNPRAQRAFAREVIALVPLAARIRRSVADRQTARAAAVLMRRPEFMDLMSNVLERMHLGIFQEEIIEPVPILSEDELNAFRVLVRGPEDNPYEPIRVAPGAPLRPPAGPHTPPRGWCSRRLIFESPRQDPTEPPPSSPQYEPVSPQYEGEYDGSQYAGVGGVDRGETGSGVEEPHLFTDITDGSENFPIDLTREGVDEGTKECPIVL